MTTGQESQRSQPPKRRQTLFPSRVSIHELKVSALQFAGVSGFSGVLGSGTGVTGVTGGTLGSGSGFGSGFSPYNALRNTFEDRGFWWHCQTPCGQ